MRATAVVKTAAPALKAKIAALSPEQRWARGQEIADRGYQNEQEELELFHCTFGLDGVFGE